METRKLSMDKISELNGGARSRSRWRGESYICSSVLAGWEALVAFRIGGVGGLAFGVDYGLATGRCILYSFF